MKVTCATIYPNPANPWSGYWLQSQLSNASISGGRHPIGPAWRQGLMVIALDESAKLHSSIQPEPPPLRLSGFGFTGCSLDPQLIQLGTTRLRRGGHRVNSLVRRPPRSALRPFRRQRRRIERHRSGVDRCLFAQHRGGAANGDAIDGAGSVHQQIALGVKLQAAIAENFLGERGHRSVGELAAAVDEVLDG